MITTTTTISGTKTVNKNAKCCSFHVGVNDSAPFFMVEYEQQTILSDAGSSTDIVTVQELPFKTIQLTGSALTWGTTINGKTITTNDVLAWLLYVCDNPASPLNQ